MEVSLKADYLDHEMVGRCAIVIHAVFWKFEYPCEARLPGSMGDPILIDSDSKLRPKN